MSSTLVVILVSTAVVILSGLADIILAATWTKGYFTSGVLVFVQHVSIEAWHNNIPTSSLLEKRLSSDRISAFAFKELDANQYGFRRNFFSFVWGNSMMHGLVIFDTENNRITVKGFLNWLMISLSILFLIIVPLMWLAEGTTLTDELWVLRLVGYLVGCGLIAGFIYLIDQYRLAKVATTAAELWSRKYDGS